LDVLFVWDTNPHEALTFAEFAKIMREEDVRDINTARAIGMIVE